MIFCEFFIRLGKLFEDGFVKTRSSWGGLLQVKLLSMEIEEKKFDWNGSKSPNFNSQFNSIKIKAVEITLFSRVNSVPVRDIRGGPKTTTSPAKNV